MREPFKYYKLCTGIIYRDFACVRTAQETQVSVSRFVVYGYIVYYVNILAVAY